jgi:hypothetical protein
VIQGRVTHNQEAPVKLALVVASFACLTVAGGCGSQSKPSANVIESPADTAAQAGIPPQGAPAQPAVPGQPGVVVPPPYGAR